MKIRSLSYEDLETGWKIENVEFGELNLLVGASGVGKTMILKVITKIASWVNHSVTVKDQAQWSITFEAEGQKLYTWSGKTVKDIKKEVSFEWEKLLINETMFAQRRQDGIVEHHGEALGRLNSKLSIVDLVEEDDVLLVKYEMSNIQYVGHTIPERVKFSYEDTLKEFEQQVKTIHKIVDLSEVDDEVFRYHLYEYIHDPIGILYILQQYQEMVFNAIKEDFSEIFPTVENLFVEPISDTSRGYRLMLYIREIGTPKPIPLEYISSGMLRTLLMLIEVHLCPNGTLLLIDEVENGLGVNCMDDIIRKLLLTYRDLQFILTSHHPYIINNIHHDNWKLVTRNGSEVVVQPINDLIDIGKSKQESFIQLVQLEQFHTGIATVA